MSPRAQSVLAMAAGLLAGLATVLAIHLFLGERIPYITVAALAGLGAYVLGSLARLFLEKP